MANNFVDVRILDNFYQTSSFFPMPVVLISTLDEGGQTNLGPYSLVYPYLIARRHGVMLITRSTSNTAQNILRTGVCAINFIPDNKKYIKNVVELGFPGETTQEKMQDCCFPLIESMRTDKERQPNTIYPEIIEDAVQVFECTWDQSYPTELNEDTQEIHFVLLIDKIVMQEKWWKNLLKGKGFPKIPVGFGFRNNTNFWFSSHSRPYAIPIPKSKGVNIDSIKFAASRIDPDLPWEEAAYAKLTQIPRIFLNSALKQILATAREQGVEKITPEYLDKVRDKRAQEKN